MKLPKLILASGSPRRAEILNSVGWEFERRGAELDETPVGGETPEEHVRRLAYAKARQVAIRSDRGLVLGADTIVVTAGMLIGKPADEAEAERMIRALSGSWHEVLTGVALVRAAGIPSFDGEEPTARDSIVDIQTTRVKFSVMTDDEIRFLVRQGDPLDKAGAYAVQAQAALFIEKIDGDYWNVVGLPVSLLYRMISRFEGRAGAGSGKV